MEGQLNDELEKCGSEWLWPTLSIFSGGTDENHENQSASLLMSQQYLILTNAK
jgi:hypothetical protein